MITSRKHSQVSIGSKNWKNRLCHGEALGGEGAMAEWGSAATALKRSIQWVRSSFWGPGTGVGADMMNMNECARKETFVERMCLF